MELLAELTRIIMTEKGLNKYAKIVAETDIVRCGCDIYLLECDKYVRKPNNLKENTHGR